MGPFEPGQEMKLEPEGVAEAFFFVDPLSWAKHVPGGVRDLTDL